MKKIILLLLLSVVAFGQAPRKKVQWLDLQEAVKDSIRSGTTVATNVRDSVMVTYRDSVAAFKDTTVTVIADTLDNYLPRNLQFKDTTQLKAASFDSAGFTVSLKQLSSTNKKGGGLFQTRPAAEYSVDAGAVFASGNASYEWVRQDIIDGKNVLNAAWYGASPSVNAAANNTAFDRLFTAAQNSATIGDTMLVYIPDGHYLVSDSFLVGNATKAIVIRGGSSTKIETSANAPILYSTGFHVGIKVLNIGFEGNGKTGGSYGIYFKSTTGDVLIRDCKFDSTFRGIRIYDATGSTIEQNKFDECGVGFYGEFQADAHRILNNQFSDSDTSIYITGSSSSGVIIDGNVFGSGDVAEIVSDAGAGVLDIRTNYLEDSKGVLQVGSNDGNTENGLRSVRVVGFNGQQGGATTSGTTLFDFWDNDIVTLSNLHWTGTADTTLFNFHSTNSRVVGYNNYEAATSAHNTIRWGAVEYDSLFGGMFLFNNPFYSRYNMNQRAAGVPHFQLDYWNAAAGDVFWQVRRVGTSARANLGSVSASYLGSQVVIGADTLGAVRFGRTATGAPAATNANVGLVNYRRYSNSSRDELNISIRDGNNGFENYNLLENRDSVFVPLLMYPFSNSTNTEATVDTVDSTNNQWIEYDFDATNVDLVTLRGITPVGWIDSTITIVITWYSAGTTNNVYWGARYAALEHGEDVDAAADKAWVETQAAVPGTANQLIRTSWNLSAKPVSAGTPFLIKLRRDPTDANDDSTSPAHLPIDNIAAKFYIERGNR